MPKAKPLTGQTIIDQVRQAVGLLDRSCRNTLIAQSNPYTTDSDKRRERAGRQDDKARALLDAALGHLAGTLIYDEATAIAEEDAIVTACAQALNVDPAQLAQDAAAIRYRRKPTPGRR